ncbi:C39 family peptidase [Mycobacterium sp. ML4]
MGSRSITALVGLLGVVAVSACTPATPSTMASPQSQVSISVTFASTAPALPSITSTTVSRTGVYGDPAAAAQYWQQQSLEDNCGLLSVADVVGQITGHAPTEQQMIALAVNTPSGTNPGPIYAPVNDPSHANGTGGIEMADEVVLLAHYGIQSAMIDAATHPGQTGMPALERYLTDNRKIIAWVNSAVIWNTGDQRTAADHFLVVTGIDTNAEVVHLNDPAAEHADEQVSISTFTTAWQTGGDSIVVTAAA